MAENLDVGMKCIKYMLFISNFMFVMVAFLLISIGSTITSIYGDFERFMETHHFSPAAIMVVVGVTIFFVAIFGCIGAIKESTVLVNLYSILLLIILILEVSAAIAAYVMRSNIEEAIEINMRSSMFEYNKEAPATESWDFAQERLQCCGVHDIHDWASQEIDGYEVRIENETFAVPRSCCVYPNCAAVYEGGCLDRLSYIISECAFMLGTGAVCVALVQILGVVFAHMLAKSIRRVKTNEEMKRQQNRQRVYDQLSRRPDEKRAPVLYTPASSDA